MATSGLAFDNVAWQEAKHPRDNDGKFASTGSANGGSSVQPSKVSNRVKDVMTAAGFKKVKNSSPTLYVHPSGAKIEIHPEPNKIHSSTWTLHKGGEKHQGVGVKLGELLKNAQEAVQKAKEQPSAQTSSELGTPSAVHEGPSEGKHAPNEMALTKLESLGYSKVPSASADVLLYKKLDHPTVSFNKATGNWSMTGGEGGIETFATYGGMATKLEQHAAAKAGSQASQEAQQQKFWGFLESGGWKQQTGFESSKITEHLYKDAKGQIVQIDLSSMQWVASSPGHLTKEGKGVENLEKLFAGQKGEWSNSSKTPGVGQTSVAAPSYKEPTSYDKFHELSAKAPEANSSQAKAISMYSGSSYQSINNLCRTSSPATVNADKTVQALDSYLNNAELPEDLTLYRKVDGQYANILKSSLVEGCIFVDKGFISTSVSTGTWSGSLKFVITAKKGTKGAAIGKWSSHKSEQEVLLPRLTKFHVTKYDHDKSLIEVEVVS